MTETERKFNEKKLRLALQLATELQALVQQASGKSSTDIEFDEGGARISYERYIGCGDYETDSDYLSLQDLLNHMEKPQ